MDYSGTVYIANHRRPSVWSRVKDFFKVFGMAVGVAALFAWTSMALVLVVFGPPSCW